MTKSQISTQPHPVKRINVSFLQTWLLPWVLGSALAHQHKCEIKSPFSFRRYIQPTVTIIAVDCSRCNAWTPSSGKIITFKADKSDYTLVVIQSIRKSNLCFWCILCIFFKLKPLVDTLNFLHRDKHALFELIFDFILFLLVSACIIMWYLTFLLLLLQFVYLANDMHICYFTLINLKHSNTDEKHCWRNPHYL